MHALCMVPLCLAPVIDLGLCAAFDRAATPAVRSRCLSEMAHRGGPVVVTFLTRKHDELRAANRNRRNESTVELLTALRRAEGKPDPLPVVLRVPDQVESIFPNLPAIDAALVNRDAQEAPVTFKEGGDYRSGRQERWRFDVRDVRGKVVPVKQHRGAGERGGLFHMGVLKHEESWATVLHMRTFIELAPGDYTVVVEYHDEAPIAGRADTAGLVVCRSEPFKLHVQPRVIDVTKADREAARDAVAALGDKGPVLIRDGPYGKAAHDFIRPDSAPGRLLVLGWRAVPALFDALDDDKATDQRRAWAFAVLFSITGWNDPRHEDGVLAAYESREGGWVVSGGRNEKGAVLGLGLGGRSSVSGGKLDGAAQKAFAKQWHAVREYIVVREKP
jgi:hypothetical protein